MTRPKSWHLLLFANIVLLTSFAWSTTRSASSPTVADVVQARQIDLVNEAGFVVAQLYVGEDGGGNLRLRSPEGDIRVKIGGSEDGAGLLLMDRSTEPGITLRTEDAGPSLVLSKTGKTPLTIAP